MENRLDTAIIRISDPESDYVVEFEDIFKTDDLGQGYYYCSPKNFEEFSLFRTWVYGLDDGIMFAVRGRDVQKTDCSQLEEDEDRGESPNYTEWERGIAIKHQRDIFFLWKHRVERYPIGVVDFMQLISLRLRGSLDSEGIWRIKALTSEECSTSAARKEKIALLCHGFSPDLGPEYLFIKILAIWLRDMGWRVITPDFRDSYRYGSVRGRSQRVCKVLEELIQIVGTSRSSFHIDNNGEAKIDDYKPIIVLIGHSQGGAAAAQACASDAVVQASNVAGLVLIGSESPIERLVPSFESEEEASDEHLIHESRPRSISAENICLIHSNRDRVISHLMIRQLSERWGTQANTHILETKSSADESINCDWADDVQHDFIADELLWKVYRILDSFLSKFQ